MVNNLKITADAENCIFIPFFDTLSETLENLRRIFCITYHAYFQILCSRRFWRLNQVPPFVYFVYIRPPRLRSTSLKYGSVLVPGEKNIKVQRRR